MTKSTAEEQHEQAAGPQQAKVVRRRRRKPPQQQQQQRNRPAAPQRSRPSHGHSSPPADPGPKIVAWTRAPRPAEAPPKDPAVFSYTYTTWKTS